MVRVTIKQTASRWIAMHSARSPVARTLWIVFGTLLGLAALGLVVVLALISLPFVLVAGAIWWVRTRLAGLKGDGRRNVRVVGAARSEI